MKNLKLSNNMKVAALIIIAVIGVLVMNHESEEETPTEQAQDVKKQENTEPKNFTKADIARFTMATVMGRNPKKMSVRTENELYYVSYIREDDKKQFNYKVKIEGKNIVWAGIENGVEGRWRNHELDGKIAYNEVGDSLKIIWDLNEKIIKSFAKGD